MTRDIRWRALVAVLVALLLFPGAVMAQNFPSQSGGDGGTGQTPEESGGFPSGGAQQPGATTQPAGRGGVAQFQRFGFSLEWGPEWTMIEQVGGPDTDVEGIALQNGTSWVAIMGIATSDTPQQIVTNLANTDPAWTFNTVIVDEPDHAAAYFDTNDPNVGGFIAARTLSSSTAMAILWGFPIAQYETEFEAFIGLLEGLR